MRRQTLWKAICAATLALGTTATNAEFIDDSQVQLKFKNFYLDRQIAAILIVRLQQHQRKTGVHGHKALPWMQNPVIRISVLAFKWVRTFWYSMHLN